MLGTHHIVDLYGVNPALLDDQEALESIVLDAVECSGASYLGHHFEPQGCSGVVLIAESHFAWHTWPEHGVMSFDFYTCGETAVPRRAVDLLVDRLNPEFVDKHTLERGRFLRAAPVPTADEPQPLVCIDGV
jgi:S-adenosylmethionine decarboxylase